MFWAARISWNTINCDAARVYLNTANEKGNEPEEGGSQNDPAMNCDATRVSWNTTAFLEYTNSRRRRVVGGGDSSENPAPDCDAARISWNTPNAIEGDLLGVGDEREKPPRPRL